MAVPCPMLVFALRDPQWTLGSPLPASVAQFFCCYALWQFINGAHLGVGQFKALNLSWKGSGQQTGSPALMPSGTAHQQPASTLTTKTSSALPPRQGSGPSLWSAASEGHGQFSHSHHPGVSFSACHRYRGTREGKMASFFHLCHCLADKKLSPSLTHPLGQFTCISISRVSSSVPASRSSDQGCMPGL